VVAFSQKCEIKGPLSFLEKSFHSGSYLSYDSTRFKNYYIDLVLLKTPLLNKAIPEYCFYTTTFLSPYYEYYNVETAIAFSKNINKKTLITHSPIFSASSEEFMKLFYGITAKDSIERINISKEIASIFSSITYNGKIERIQNLIDPLAISFELWHNDLSWKIYNFNFDEAGNLKSIKISAGFKHSKDIVGYKRI